MMSCSVRLLWQTGKTGNFFSIHTTIKMDIGATVRRLRRNRNLTQGELARRCEISQTYLSQIEKNNAAPTLEMVQHIASLLGVPYPVFMFLTLDENDVEESKKAVFRQVAPSILGMVEHFFLS